MKERWDLKDLTIHGLQPTLDELHSRVPQHGLTCAGCAREMRVPTRVEGTYESGGFLPTGGEGVCVGGRFSLVQVVHGGDAMAS